MHFLRRLLYVPIIIVLVGAMLLIFNVIDLDWNLPISAELIAIIAGGMLTLFAVMDMRAAASASDYPEPEEPPRTTKIIYPKVLEDAVDSFHEAEEFVIKANGRVEIEIDIEEDPEEEK